MSGNHGPMPKRERFLEFCRGERPGEVPMLSWFHRYWAETPVEWVRQGAPPEIATGEGFRSYFQLDHLHGLEEIVSEVNRADVKEDATAQGPGMFHVTPPVVPVFPLRVLREDEKHRVETTYGGSIVEVSKDHPWRMPRFLEYPVKDWATWKEYRKRLDPYTPERWPKDWYGFVERRNSEDVPTMFLMAGFFGVLREWCGLERLLYLFYDDPLLVEDMMEQVLYLIMGVAWRVVKDLRIEAVRFWEDMAFRSGPLISPAMVRRFMAPRYKQVTEFLHKHGIDVVHLDSDGNVMKLVPIWMECGVNFPWPFEVAAGNDMLALRREYGKDIILGGGIDKRCLIKGKEAIDAEVMGKVPTLISTGGYFPGCDHGIPPDVSFENYKYFVNLLREINGQEKLPY
jgi:hypothetical protein